MKIDPIGYVYECADYTMSVIRATPGEYAPHAVAVYTESQLRWAREACALVAWPEDLYQDSWFKAEVDVGEQDQCLDQGDAAMTLLTDEKIDAVSDATFKAYMEDRIDNYDKAFARTIEAAVLENLKAQELWREHVEQRLLNWRQRFVNRSGDQLALDDFMDKRSLDDLIDYVCDEYAMPAQAQGDPRIKTLNAQQFEIADLRERITELEAQNEKLEKALLRISMTHYHMETPPSESLPEQMRNMARDALSKREVKT